MKTINNHTARKGTIRTRIERILNAPSFPYFSDKRSGKISKRRIKIAYIQATDNQRKAIVALPHVVKVENVMCISHEGNTYPAICIWLDCSSLQTSSI